MENKSVKMCPFRKKTVKTSRKEYPQNFGGTTVLVANANEPTIIETVAEDFLPCLLENCPYYDGAEDNCGVWCDKV